MGEMKRSEVGKEIHMEAVSAELLMWWARLLMQAMKKQHLVRLEVRHHGGVEMVPVHNDFVYLFGRDVNGTLVQVVANDIVGVTRL